MISGMERLIMYLLGALAVGTLFFGWGYHRGAASVEASETVRVDTVYFEKPHPVRISDRLLSVNVPKWLFATQPRNDDSSATNILENGDSYDDSSGGNGDSSDSLTIPITERTVEYRDSTYCARVVGPVVGTLAPRLDFIETYNTTTTHRQAIRDPPRWEAGPAAGVWASSAGGGVWVGAFARRSFGRFSLSASAGYDTHNNGVFGQVQAGIAIWRK